MLEFWRAKNAGSGSRYLQWYRYRTAFILLNAFLAYIIEPNENKIEEMGEKIVLSVQCKEKGVSPFCTGHSEDDFPA
jgi:hypothetical protein